MEVKIRRLIAREAFVLELGSPGSQSMSVSKAKTGIAVGMCCKARDVAGVYEGVSTGAPPCSIYWEHSLV